MSLSPRLDSSPSAVKQDQDGDVSTLDSHSDDASDENMSPKRALDAKDEDADDERQPKRAKKRTYVKGTSKLTKDESDAKAVISYHTLPRYVKLLKSDRLGSATGTDSIDTYGTVTWSGEEFDRFYALLNTKGRHDLAGISSGIGTKTEPEVADLLLRLRHAWTARHLDPSTNRTGLLRYHELPAATEVDESLGNLLDTLADSALAADFDEALQDEQELNGDYAVLDADNAHIFYDENQTDDGEPDEHAETSPDDDAIRLKEKTLTAAASVLDLPRMLELSQYIFMNSKIEDESWQTLSGNAATPSLLQTALIELYASLVSAAERLASTAHFLALSRIRATDNKIERSVLQEVRSQDVSAAVDILNMEHNTHSFWITCPRKCRLRVYKGRKGTSKAEKLSYDQVEQLLGEEGRWPKNVRGRKADDITSGTSDVEDAQDIADDESIASFGSQTTRANSRATSRASSHAESRNGDSAAESEMSELDDDDNHAGEVDREDADEADFADTIDMQNSKLEEERLRAALQGRKNAKAKTKEEGASPAPPKLKRKQGRKKTLEEVKDWAKWTKYQSQWERYPQPLPEDGIDDVQSFEEEDGVSLAGAFNGPLSPTFDSDSDRDVDVSGQADDSPDENENA